MAGEDEEEFSPEEEALFRFRYENEVAISAVDLGVVMDDYVHRDPAGVELIQRTIDELHVHMMMLVDYDLQTENARQSQVDARACLKLINMVRKVLDDARDAAIALSDADQEEEGHGTQEE